jgi:outer membrane receptor protein involved in Fe transport
VPGLVLAQHQGGGKADQLFLRGFDADHGTDVAVSIDGVPVNLPSHGHGQGYADLHFLIPEAIERLDIRKGPYFADLGDFDTAGAVNLVTRGKFEHSSVSAMAGVFPTLVGQRTDGTARRFSGYRVLGIAAPGGDLSPYFAAEVFGTGGPFLHSENLERYNLFAKATAQLSSSSQLSLLAMAYSSSWHGSGQIPARAVDSGTIDRYGAIDPSEGGVTQRQQAIASLVTHPDARSKFSATLSAIHYDLTLFSDFTFFAADPLHGDEIEQGDRRVVLYGALRYERRDGFFVSTLGAQYRADLSEVSLWRVQQRARLPRCLEVANPCLSTSNRQVDAAAYVQEDLRPARWLRVVLGLRSDTFHFNVRGLGGDPAAQRSIVSPKASVVLSPAPWMDLYLNFGSGFHSNDARSAVETGGAGALPRALGYEAGARTRLLDGRVELAAALWRLDLESELVWSGDTGGTSSSGATRRIGLDFEGRWRILDWLYADLDVSLATSRYKVDSGNGGAVALAPPRIVTGGLTAQHPSGLRASLRARHVGTRPATQLTSSDGVPPCTPSLGPDSRCYLVAEGYTVFDAALSWTMRRWTATLIAENLTNAHYREAQFGDVSRLAGESHAVRDIHYTPGNPLGLQLALGYEF